MLFVFCWAQLVLAKSTVVTKGCSAGSSHSNTNTHAPLWQSHTFTRSSHVKFTSDEKGKQACELSCRRQCKLDYFTWTSYKYIVASVLFYSELNTFEKTLVRQLKRLWLPESHHQGLFRSSGLLVIWICSCCCARIFSLFSVPGLNCFINYLPGKNTHPFFTNSLH